MSFVAWAVGSFFDDEAKNISRSLDEARSEAVRAADLELLTERLVDLRDTAFPGGGEARCTPLLEKVPTIVEGDGRDGALEKDRQCIAIVKQVQQICSAEDRRLELRVRTAEHYAKTMRNLIGRLESASEVSQSGTNLIKTLEDSALAYDRAKQRFVATFGQITVQDVSPSARNCNALHPIRSNRQEMIREWEKHSSQFNEAVRQAPELLNQLGVQIDQALVSARKRATRVHVVALCLAAIALILAIWEKMKRNDGEHSK